MVVLFVSLCDWRPISVLAILIKLGLTTGGMLTHI